MLKTDIITVAQIIFTLPVCFLITKLTIVLVKKIKFVNHPNPIVETHKVETAYGGGLAIASTIIFFLIFQSINFQIANKFIFILLPVILIGLFDDIFKFSPFNKLLLQIIAGLPFLFFYINSSIPLVLIFLFFIVLSQNAWNLIDIMDGLTAGISFIVFLSAGVILKPHIELELYSSLSIAIAFSLLGFRFLNKSPAKIFLGETGSLLLGTLFAFIVVSTYLVNEITAYFLMLLGSIPFFELIFLIIVRTIKRIPFYRGSPDHFALRMQNNGFSVKSINVRVILICTFHAFVIVFANLLAGNTLVLIICICLSLISSTIAFFYFQSLPAREVIR